MLRDVNGEKVMKMGLLEYYRGKKILVTGGAGSIGSQLVRDLLGFRPKVVRVLDNNETGLFDLEQELQSQRIRILVGDVRERDRLRRAVEDVDIVFHVAALKHVPLCEYNPFDAVRTNVIGTENVMNASLDEEVEKVILVSTDKAVNASNVMGATKLLAERLTVSANHYKGKRRTALSCVRFGNVLDSRGSLLQILRKQIANGGPVTITDPEMTRFVMGVSKAVELILKATVMARGGEIFILKMPSLRVADLIEAIVETLAPCYGFQAREIAVRRIGRRAGEKLFEELMTIEEAGYAVEKDGMYVLDPTASASSRKRMTPDRYSSDKVRKLSRTEIRSLLREIAVN